VKFISGLFKFIAGVLMAVFVFGLPFALLIQGFGSLLLSPGKMVEMLEDHIIDPEIISSYAEYQVSQLEFEATSENAVLQIAVDGLSNMDHEEWLLLTNLLAPPELISQTIDDGLEGYYGWLDGTSPVPGIQIDLKPWKSNLSTNFIPVLELIMFALPECTDAQQLVFLAEVQLGSEITSCRPQDPIYALFIEQAGIFVPSLLENMPNEYNLGRALQQNDQIDWVAAKESLSGLATISQNSWIVLLIVFAIAIPMGARSFSDVFSWSGWPILLAGLITLVIGALLLLFSQGGLADLNPTSDMLLAAPDVLTQSLRKLIGAGLRFVARPMLIEAGAMILLGGLAVVLAIIISSRSKQTNIAETVPAVGSGVTEPTPVVTPSETLELSEDQFEGSPDDDKPSGMFG